MAGKLVLQSTSICSMIVAKNIIYKKKAELFVQRVNNCEFVQKKLFRPYILYLGVKRLQC